MPVINNDISRITGVPLEVLDDPVKVHSASIAQRMSWAVKRLTTRPEDMAYCMLGLFNISMPLLYGEGGHAAFERLQTKINSRFDGESLFAFTPMHKSRSPRHLFGMLATSPADFAGCGDFWKHRNHSRPPNASTNRGIQIYIPAKCGPEDPEQSMHVIHHGAYRSRSNFDRIMLFLNCSRFAGPLRAPPPALSKMSVKRSGLPGLVCSISLKLLPCGHYGRERHALEDSCDWIPLTKAEVLYVHRSSAHASPCFSDGSGEKKQHRRQDAKL